MKKVLILGTGAAQADIIEACKKKGLYVYACSYLEGDLAQGLADEFELIDISDADAITEFAKKKQVDYIYSLGSNVAMPSLSKACEALNLPCYVSYKTALTCNTKTALRGVLGNDFEGNLRYQEISDISDNITIGYPAVIKPADSQGQRGVYKIDNYNDFTRFFSSSMSFSKNRRIIVEEFIDGDEVSVNVFSKNGEIIFSLISDRITWNCYPGGVIQKHIIPSKYSSDKETENKILDLVKRVLGKLEIKDGPSYFQIKLKGGKEPKLVEVTPRLDGCHLWRLIRFSTGIDLLDMTISCLFDGHIQNTCLKFDVKPCCLEFLSEEPDKKFNRSKYDLSDAKYLRWYCEDGQKLRKTNGFIEKGGYKITE